MTSVVLKRLATATAFAGMLAGLVASASAQNTSGVPVPAQPAWNKGNPGVFGKQIVTYLDRADRGWVDQYAKSSITIVNARGEKTTSSTRQLTLEGKNGNKSLIRYMSPANVRGVAALTHEHHKATDDSWLYLPSSRRVRRISGANRTASFQGTEFTYEDLSRYVPSRYKWRYLQTTKVRGKPVYKLRAIPTYRNSGYSKLHVYINYKKWRTERIEFYDKAKRLLKVLDFTKFRLYHGRFWRARKMVMSNKQTQKKSIIAIKTQFINVSLYKKKDGSPRKGLSAGMFTRRALESR